MTAARRRDPFLLIPPIIAAVFLGSRNENFGFDPPGLLDSFMYFGYFWHYPAHLPILDHDYKASRLPWILPGYALHWLGDPVAASYILVFATLSAGGIALYLLVRDITHDRPAAAVIAAAWTSCTWAHGIGGWNYHMLAAADYFLAASWLAFRTATSGSRSAALGSGICAAAAVHTHLFFASFLPLLAFNYWSGLPSLAPRWLRFAWHSVAWVAGAAGITLALAAINAATGGDWLFFMPQIMRALYVMPYDDSWLEARAWLPTARNLILPTVFMVTGLLMSLHREREPGERSAVRWLTAQASLALITMCIAQFARRLSTLDWPYIAFPLYVCAFACGGAALATGRSRRYPAALVAISVLLIVAPLLWLMPDRLPRLMSVAAAAVTAPAVPAVVPPLVFALLSGLLTITAPARARLLVFAGWFGVLNAWIAPAPTAYGINTPGYRREMLELLREVDGMTAAFDPRLDGIKYWFTEEHIMTRLGDVPLGWLFDSYVATRGWHANLLAHESSEVSLQQLTLEQLQQAVCVALLSSPGKSASAEEEFRAHFNALGRPLRRVTIRHLKRRDLAFDVVLLKPSDAIERRGPPCMWR